MDEKLHELRRRLDQKTTEIESLVASERGLGSIENMDPSDYGRLQQDVEELLEQWEETAQQEGPGGMDDTPLNRLIAERFEIDRDQAPACLRERLPPRRLSKNQDGQHCRERRLELEPEARAQCYCDSDPKADRKRPGTDGKSRETERKLSCRRECRRRPNGQPYRGFICLLVFEACHVVSR